GKRWLAIAIFIIALAAIAFVWLASDPGYVLIRFRGWRIEATVIGAVAILVAAWIAIGIVWWLLRWPFGALSRRHRRISQERLRDGLVAMTEGRHVEASRTLQRAAQYSSLRSPALLSAADAAHRHGDTQRALEALDEAAQHAPEAARILRARILRENDRAEEALQLLTPGAEAGKLRPAGTNMHWPRSVLASPGKRAPRWNLCANRTCWVPRVTRNWSTGYWAHRCATRPTPRHCRNCGNVRTGNNARCPRCWARMLAAHRRWASRTTRWMPSKTR